MILDKNKNKIKPYYSNYKPCNIYKGKEKITGYSTTTVNNNTATFENTYNDFIELSMTGKAKQNQYEGYNLLENLLQNQTVNGVTFTVNADKSVYIKGTASARTEVNLWTKSTEKTLTLKMGVIYYNNTNDVLYFHGSNGYFLVGKNQTYMPEIDINLNRIYIRVEASETIDKIIYPMLTTKENLLDLSKTQTFTQYGKTVNIENYKIKLTCEKSTSVGSMCIKLTNGYDLSFNDGGDKWNNEIFIKAGNYTLSATKTQKGSLALYVKYIDGKIDFICWGDKLTQSIKLQNKDIVCLFVQAAVNNGASANNEMFDIKLIDNTVEKNYEQYCGGMSSPNLDYPQEIKKVDKVSVKVTSKNLIKDSLNYGVGNPDYAKIWDFSGGAQYDTDITYNGMKVVNITNNWNRRMQYVDLKNETVYTLSAYVKNNDEARTDDYVNHPSRVEVYGQSETNSKCTIINKSFESSNSAPVPKEWTRISVTFKTGTADVFNGKSKIRFEPNCLDYKNHKPNIYMCGYQLEEGDTMTEYEADFPTTETELLNNEVLVSLPNGAKDEIRENKLIKRVGKILINENSMPKIYYEIVGDYYGLNYNFSSNSKVKNVVNKTANNFMSNRLNSKNIEWAWGINKENWYLADNHLVFKVPKTTIERQKGVNDKEKITNYLKANPIVFYAELETPQEIAIGKIKSLPLTTKVDINANLDTEITIKCKEME